VAKGGFHAANEYWRATAMLEYTRNGFHFDGVTDLGAGSMQL
jgi:hypothetical protein